ncbi:unannotated protein [freshwater metagenome]|uniref:Unannotated protein n=1 Tax=freshwater metagenome TaxID=449393 RepID=A0A6J6UQD6_9ZZZZ
MTMTVSSSPAILANTDARDEVPSVPTTRVRMIQANAPSAMRSVVLVTRSCPYPVVSSWSGVSSLVYPFATPLTPRRMKPTRAMVENRWTALRIGRSRRAACTARAKRPPIQIMAAATWETPAVSASAWSPIPAPWPASAGRLAATTEMRTHAAADPVVEVAIAETHTTPARTVMASRALVIGISLTYVVNTAGSSAVARGTPRTSARVKSICAQARTAQTPAAMTARLRSARPSRETIPPLPAGSRKAAARSQPTVAIAARLVSRRRIAVPHTTIGPASVMPGGGAS